MNQNQIDRLYKMAINVNDVKVGLTSAGKAISDAASTAGQGIVSGVQTAGDAIGNAYNSAKDGINSLPRFDFDKFKQLIHDKKVQAGAAAAAVAGVGGVGAYKMMKKREKED